MYCVCVYVMFVQVLVLHAFVHLLKFVLCMTNKYENAQTNVLITFLYLGITKMNFCSMTYNHNQ